MQEPERIAQVIGWMNGGGVEAVVMNYYRHIDRDRFQFDFILNQGSTHPPTEEIESLGGRVFEVPGPKRALAFHRSLSNLFREQNWRIVHSHINTLSSISLHAAKSAGVPIRIAHAHSTTEPQPSFRRYAKLMLRPLLGISATHRLACGRLSGDWMFKGAPYDLLHNAVELERFRFDCDKRAGIRDGLGISPDTFVLGHIGRLVPQKNQVYLLRFFSELLKERPNSILLIIGSGYLEQELVELARSLGVHESIRFLSQVDETGPYYSAFDVFALPSLYEGMPVVAVEAQEAGLPCLLSDEVSTEAVLSPSCVRLPLSRGMREWVDGCLGIAAGDRTEPDCETFEPYDIQHEAHKLEDYYEAVLNRLR